MIRNTLVMGAGSWGAALAIHLAHYGHPTTIWSYKASHVKALQKDNENKAFLPGIQFPKNLYATYDWKTALKEADMVLIGVPSNAFSDVLKKIAPHLSGQGILWATKGFCHDSYRFLHEIAEEVLPKGTPMGLITGPSFAKEVATFLPTAVVVASKDQAFAQDVQTLFNSPTFRTYITDDLVGVQVGGAVKNALAIATGISDGMGFGANARAGLITRGLAEMIRLGIVLGAKEKTLMGLGGMGDLILTCTDNQSRNRRYGLALGAGKNSEEAIKEIGQVVEGIPTTLSIYHLAKKHKVSMPIVEQIYHVLYDGLSAQEAVKNLMMRDAKPEGL
jgi:glycerol-3-phosphate dehydrogenase (NAD(P)+)